MMKHCRTLMMAALIAVLLGAGVSSARADNPRSITVMTQNLYQGTELANTLAARDRLHFVLGVAADYNNVIATDFPERADALAAEIAQSGPAIVGLQEVALWRTQSPYNPASLPQTVSYDFLQILLDALAAHGMQYTTVITRDNYDVSGPGLFSFGLMGVRLTDRTVILARTDLPTDELTLSSPQQGAFQHIGMVQTLFGPVPISGGWLAVDAKTRGKTFRFITTHLLGPVLDGSPDPLLPQQAQELLDGPAQTDLTAVIAGDFNSTPADPAYATLVGAGFEDEWAAANPGDPGFTAFQNRPGISNPIPTLHNRIDYVLARGLFAPLDMHLIGADPSSRTASGLWPSDHAGVVATLEIGPQPGLRP
jgi:Endonuclease/Exonuclease/phosphatase family